MTITDNTPILKLQTEMTSDLSHLATDDEFIKMMIDTHNAKSRAEYLDSLLKKQSRTKGLLKDYIKRYKYILDDFRFKMPDHFRKTFDESALNNEDAMQADTVLTMFMHLPKYAKDIVEKKIEEMLTTIHNHDDNN